jgi:hypothetical protein
MKKILILLLSIGLFSASFAQGKHHQKNNYDRNDQYASASDGRYDKHNDGRYNNNRNVSYENQRAIEIQRINRQYNYKIQSIENNRYMKNRQKKIAIREANKERTNEIQMLNGRFDGYKNHGNFKDRR